MKSVLTKEQGQSLLQLARQTIAERLGVESEAATSEDSALDVECGTFVTLKIDGILRGCIGNLIADESVAEGVRRNAINAAFRDHRFTSLTVDEFGKVDIDISVLSQPQKLEYRDGADLISKLRPGKDGVILQLDGAGATFLPQVWEQLPIPEMFLGRLCQKAGLADSAWRDSHPKIEIYQVQSFKEEKG
jgi:uncharacterized protein